MAWARLIAAALGAFLLTASIAVWIFPYERVAQTLSDSATAWSGIELEFEQLGPTLSFGGVGLEATNTRATLPRGDSFVLPSLFLRPAWSPRWLLGDPQLLIQLDAGALGTLEGVAGLGRGGSWNARLSEVRVGVLPLEQLIPGLSMEGQLSGVIDVALDDTGRPTGLLDLEFSNGSLLAPGLPLPLPYERLNGDIELGGETFATVRGLAIAGPMLNATLSGTVGHAERRGSEPLDFEMQIQRVARALQPMLRDLGLELAQAGPTRLEITGTLSRPTFR